MKNVFTQLVICIIAVNFITAQEIVGITGIDNWTSSWTEFNPSKKDYREADVILSGEISKNTKLQKQFVYLLTGVVYVTNNATLSIEPGTIIRGDKETCSALVITKGAKLNAEGTASSPIVFTSNLNTMERKPGDWGGIVILGDAPINKIGGQSKLDFDLNPMYNNYGGENSDSSSGKLSYVRIEFAGKKIKNGEKEYNGLSLAAVGSNTTINYVQVSYSNDDSFECYGGNVNLNGLISYRATDDDFDFTEGVQSTISNSIALRHPFSSDISRSRCFEVDTYTNASEFDMSRLMTNVKAENITMINLKSNNQGLVKEAININKDTYFYIKNAVTSGFESFVLLNKNIKTDIQSLKKIFINNCVINSCNKVIISDDSVNNFDLSSWYNNTSSNIKVSNKTNEQLFKNLELTSNPDFRMNTNTESISMSRN